MIRKFTALLCVLVAIALFGAPMVNAQEAEDMWTASSTPSTWYQMGVAETHGMNGSYFSSQLNVTNLGSIPTSAVISYIPRPGNPGGPPVTITLGAGESRQFEEVLKTLFGLSETSGALAITANAPLKVFGVSMNTADPKGTYGLSLIAIRDTEFITVGQVGKAIFVTQNADYSVGFRTNVAVFLPDADSLAEVRIYDMTGLLKKSFTVTGGPLFSQWSLRELLGADVDVPAGYVTFIPSRGRVSGYGVMNDNLTSDAVAMIAEKVPTTPTDTLFSGIAKTLGYNQTFWQSELRLHNPTSTDASITLSPFFGLSPEPASLTKTIPANGLLVLDKIVDAFLAPDGTVGSVRITSPSPIQSAGRTYNSDPSGAPGTYSAQLQPINTFLTAGQIGYITGAFNELNTTEKWRTNVAIIGGPIGTTGRLVLRDRNGFLLGANAFTRGPYQFGQLNVANWFGGILVPDNARLDVEVTTGSLSAYASRVDNGTGDGVTLQAELMPTIDPPTLSFNGPSSVCANTQAMVSYAASDPAASVNIDGIGTGLPSSGSFQLSVGVSATTVTGRATNVAGTGPDASFTISPIASPTSTLSGSAQLVSGENQVLSWSVSGEVTSQTLNDSLEGNFTLTSTQSSEMIPTPRVGHHVATHTAVTQCGTTISTFSYDVETACVAPQVTSFTVTPSSACGTSASVTLAWAVAGDVTNVSIPGVSGSLPSTGTTTISASSSKTFVLTATGPCGSDSSTKTFTLNANPDATISAPSAVEVGSTGNAASVPNAGSGATYTWGISNGTITSGAGTRNIIFTAGSTGTLTLSVTVRTSAGCMQSSSRAVAVSCTPPVMTISAGGPTTFCQGGNVVLTALPAGLASYLWSNGQVTPTITVSTSASITVTGTNVQGCSNTSSVTTVTVNPNPVSTVTAPAATCANSTGNAASVPAQAGATYSWSITNGTITSGAGTNAIQFTAGASGTVALTATVTNNGCSSTSNANVAITPNPVSTVTAPAATCANSTGNAASVPAQAGATYSWSITNGTITSGAGTNAIQFTAGASGTVALTATVTNNGCSSTSNANVAINPPPNPLINASGPTAFCAGGSVTLSTAVPYASYQWSTGETSPTITVSTSASITVTVTTALGCPGTSAPIAVTVTPNPVSTVTAPAATCANSTGNAASVPAQAGATYSWSITNGTITSGAGTNAIQFTAGASGTVALTATVTNNGCSSTGNANVAINPPPSATITAPSAICADQSNVAASIPSAGAGASYFWSAVNATITSGAGTNAITFTPTIFSGTITLSVSVTNATGCSNTSNANVTVNPLPSTLFTAPASVCANSTSNAVSVPNAGAGATYGWTLTNATLTSGNGTNAITFTAGPSGTANISVYITVPTGCTNGDFVNIPITPNPVSTVTAPAATCANSTGNAASVPAQAGATYSWSITNGTITSGAGTNAIQFTAGASGTVALTATVTNNGCSSTGNANVAINPNPVATISPSGPTTMCEGPDSVTLTALPGGMSYAWSNGATTQSITISPAVTTSYFVTVTNVSGCSNTSAPTTVTINPQPVISSFTATPSTINGGDTATLNFTISNSTSWSLSSALGNSFAPGVGVGSGTFSPTYNADNAAGTDTVTLTVIGPCGTKTQTVQIIVN